jgi:hypothetical protein
MAGVTTALATSFKKDLLNGFHSMAAPTTATANVASASTSVTSLSSCTGICLGMSVTGTNIAASTFVAGTGTTTLTLSKASTGAISGGTLSFAADSYSIALVKTSPGGTFDATMTNYSSLSSDEVSSGSGYTTGGIALTSAGAVTSGTTAIMDFADVSWTSASFSCTGAVIYQTNARAEGVTGRVVSTHSIGDTTVSSGTLSLIFPTPDASNAIIRLN